MHYGVVIILSNIVKQKINKNKNYEKMVNSSNNHWCYCFWYL